MTVRGRLIAFSAAQFVGFGLMLAIGYYELESNLLPMFYEELADRARTTAIDLAGDVDVALAAEDPKLALREIDATSHDSAFAFVTVRTAMGTMLVHSGSAFDHPFDGPARSPRRGDGVVYAWSDVTLEGVKLGSISVGFDTSGIDRIDAWITALAAIALVAWLVGFVYSFIFARSFVTPIHAMKNFSRKVAGGDLSDELTIAAPGELRELRDYLNAMARELEAREREREAAARRDEEMQRELVTVSRLAGMAEIATGVLHNVGNVLNSLNVSITVLGDQLRDSKVSSLARTVELYTSHPRGFDGFLETDKGKLLPSFLASVSKRLTAENASAREELAAVMKNVEHIKTIVATQQRYANTFGVQETLDVESVITDALRMGESSLARHDIALERDFPVTGVPQIASDRHKLLQILINLISNAGHAIKDGNPDERRIAVRVRHTSSRISIAVADTGVGIVEGNLARIFQHGFTTRKDGHGFGLHASANAARELGGKLVAASDGFGKGATFTLELPMNKDNRRDRN